MFWESDPKAAPDRIRGMMQIMLKSLIVGIVVTFATVQPLLAMTPVRSEAELMQLLKGKDITIRLFALRLSVLPDGTIMGRAAGRDVTGSWSWIDGYFCREMFWGKREIEYNCQLVEWDGTSMRFTVDRGKGESADFRRRPRG